MSDLDSIKNFVEELEEASTLLKVFIDGEHGYKVAGKKARLKLNDIKKKITEIKKITVN